MVELLALLLPLAFYSGWKTARNQDKKQQETNRKLSDNFVKGINYLLNEQPDKALEVFLSHPEIDEYTAETYRLLGNMFRNRGEINRALSLHQNLIARPNMDHKQRVDSMLAYGEDFFAAGMLDRAESVFQELLKSEQDSPQARNTLRSIYEQLQDWDKAIEVTQFNLKANNNPLQLGGQKKSKQTENQSRLIAHYYCELAQQELENGNIHKVEQHIQSALKVNKHSTRIRVLQGDLSFRKGGYTQALKSYQNVIEDDPRLIGMLGDRIITAAESNGSIDDIQRFLLKLSQKQNDKHILEFITQITITHGADENFILQIEDLITQHKPSLRSILGIIKLWKQKKPQMINAEKYEKLILSLETLLKEQPDFQCHHCGYRMHNYLWRCPACHHWDTVAHL